MDDPFDFLEFDAIVQHGDPKNWKHKGAKSGSGAIARSPNAPSGTVKIYEIYADEFGKEIELHYFRHSDGRVSQVKVTPRRMQP